MVLRVLFVGLSNTRRSRFAEGYFNALAREHGIGWKAFSRGLHAGEALERIDPDLLPLLERWGVASSDLGATKLPLTVRDLMSAQRVVLWADTVAKFEQGFPSWCHKVEGWDTGSEGLESLPVIAEWIEGLLGEISGRAIPPRRPAAAVPAGSAARSGEGDDGADAAQLGESLENRVGPDPAPGEDGADWGEEEGEDIGFGELFAGRAVRPGHGNSFRHSRAERPASARAAVPSAAVLESSRSNADSAPSGAATGAETPAPAEANWHASVPLPRPVKAALRLRRSL